MCTSGVAVLDYYYKYYKKPFLNMMDDEQLNKFKKQLEERRNQLNALASTNEESVETVELDQTRQGRLTRMDALQGQAMSLAAKNRRLKELKEIGEALERIESGDYGYCQNCGNEIAVDRLQINLTADYCIHCAEKLEG